MKVVCDGCQAKYKLTDGRLAGRTLKFRCRKCGNTIVIDGAEFRPALSQGSLSSQMGEDAFAQDAGAPFEAAAPDWYLSINGEPYGPCSTEQMSNLLCDGQVPWETYVWREGYADWKAASESNTLVAAAEALLAESGEAGYAGEFAEHGDTVTTGFDDPDWSAPSDAYSEIGGARASYPEELGISARVHEDPTRVAYVDPHTGRPPFGDAEMSGLIDIRALAALAGTSGRSASLGVGQPDSHGDDRLSFTSPGERLPGHPDTLAPVARNRRLPRGKALPFAILSGSALIAAATFIAIYSSSSASTGAGPVAAVADEAPIAVGAEPVQKTDKNAIEPGPAAPAAAPPASAVATEQPEKRAAKDEAPSVATTASAIKEAKPANRGAVLPAATAAGKPAANAGAANTASPDTAAQNIASQNVATNSGPAALAAPEAAETPASADGQTGADPNPYRGAEHAEHTGAASSPARSSANRSIDELLDEAIPSDDHEFEKSLASSATTRAPTHSGAALPETPSRDQVVAAMRAIEPDVRACTQGQTLDSYTAAASFTVSGLTGRVGNVRVSGVQGAVNACIVRAVRNAMLPAFAKNQLRINFPFRLGP